MTTVTLGGLKSKAQTQAAAMILRLPAYAEVMIVVGPWLISLMALSRDIVTNFKFVMNS